MENVLDHNGTKLLHNEGDENGLYTFTGCCYAELLKFLKQTIFVCIQDMPRIKPRGPITYLEPSSLCILKPTLQISSSSKGSRVLSQAT